MCTQEPFGKIINQLTESAFKELCDEWVPLAIGEARSKEISLGSLTEDALGRACAILIAANIFYSATPGNAGMGVRLASMTLAMLGVRPYPDAIRQVLTLSITPPYNEKTEF